MLAKLVVTISILLNPLAFLFSQTPLYWMAGGQNPIPEDMSDLASWQESLLSALLISNPNFLPIRNWGVDEPDVEARAALIYDLGKDKILYQKNKDQILPIASLTKLTTALVVLENLNLDEVIVVSKKAVAFPSKMGGLMAGEKITVENLLYALLMESSNDAAVALAEKTEELTGYVFTDLMNKKAGELGLIKTYFTDPSGYGATNVSTAYEINKLVKYSLNQPLIWQIMKTPAINLFSADGGIEHHWTNTDKLLNKMTNIVGGKTGYTYQAGGCLVLVVEQPNSSRITSVVLGAEERFLETEKLVNWVSRAYRW